MLELGVILGAAVTGMPPAVGYVMLMSRDWLVRPTLLLALLYDIVTVVFPFFIMQPSFSLGVASSLLIRPFRGAH